MCPDVHLLGEPIDNRGLCITRYLMMKWSEVKWNSLTQSCPTLCNPMDYSPWNSPGQNTGVGRLSLLQGIFPTQGSNPGLLHCRQILHQLSHKGSPRILERVAYPFSRGSSQPRNWTRVSCIAGGFFTNWVIREAPDTWCTTELPGKHQHIIVFAICGTQTGTMSFTSSHTIKARVFC